DVARRAPSGFVHYAVDSYPLRLLMLDTQDEGRDGGLLCAERLGWIGRRLAESSRPTLVFMHHPPFDYGLASNPDMHCAGADRFGQIVARHRHVEGIFAGHLHRATIVRWCGTVAGTVPATAPLFQLPLAGGAPAGWIGAAAGLGLHLWRPGGGVVSHVVAVDEPARLVPFAKRA
ncbi:MAG: phosphodiesterase, partial [Proteobacteria bacterium]|nr:phosphodiesterase [Pseudomonadota bacterium]